MKRKNHKRPEHEEKQANKAIWRKRTPTNIIKQGNADNVGRRGRP